MTQNINSFSPNREKGQLVNDIAASTITCKISSTSTEVFGPATAVKIINVAGATLPVVEKAAATDSIFGFISYNYKSNTPVAGDLVEISSFGQEMVMEAGGAIAGGGLVEIVAATDKVAGSAGTNKVVGINMIRVGADGELTRVLIQTPKVNQL
tara:strand:- start:497 stop:958 length:462 start_codon:yes stop_codon:yes gene_type:complete